MPKVRKMAPEEVAMKGGAKGSVRAEVEREYDGYLAGFLVGEYGIAELDEKETKQTVRKRLLAAAERRGMIIRFIKTKGNIVRFKLEDESIEEDVYWPTEATQQIAA